MGTKRAGPSPSTSKTPSGMRLWKRAYNQHIVRPRPEQAAQFALRELAHGADHGCDAGRPPQQRPGARGEESREELGLGLEEDAVNCHRGSAG